MQTKMSLYQGHLFLVWLKNANYSKRGEVKSTTAAKLLWRGGGGGVVLVLRTGWLRENCSLHAFLFKSSDITFVFSKAHN